MGWRARQALGKVARYGAGALIVGALVFGAACVTAPSDPLAPAEELTDLSEAELRQDIYEAAVDACSAFPPRSGETAVGAAQEYAQGYQDQFEQAAFEGCLDGFRAAGALP